MGTGLTAPRACASDILGSGYRLAMACDLSSDIWTGNGSRPAHGRTGEYTPARIWSQGDHARSGLVVVRSSAAWSRSAGGPVDDARWPGIRIDIDRKLQGVTNPSVQRPDVSKPLPTHVHGHSGPSNRHGRHVVIDLGDLARPHTILVAAFHDEAARREVGSVVASLIGRP